MWLLMSTKRLPNLANVCLQNACRMDLALKWLHIASIFVGWLQIRVEHSSVWQTVAMATQTIKRVLELHCCVR